MSIEWVRAECWCITYRAVATYSPVATSAVTSVGRRAKLQYWGKRAGQKSEARVCSTGGGSDPTEDPVGWQTSWNQGLPAGKRRVARCHLLGKQFGGAGTRTTSRLAVIQETYKWRLSRTKLLLSSVSTVALTLR